MGPQALPGPFLTHRCRCSLLHSTMYDPLSPSHFLVPAWPGLCPVTRPESNCHGDVARGTPKPKKSIKILHSLRPWFPERVRTRAGHDSSERSLTGPDVDWERQHGSRTAAIPLILSFPRRGSRQGNRQGTTGSPARIIPWGRDRHAWCYQSLINGCGQRARMLQVLGKVTLIPT